VELPRPPSSDQALRVKALALLGRATGVVSRRLPPLGRRLEDLDHICTSFGLDAHNFAVGRCPTGDVGVPCGGLCGNDGVEE
jgi:hypothetical protein